MQHNKINNLALILLISLNLSCALTALSAQAEECATPRATGTGTAHSVQVDGHPIALWSKTPATPPKATLLLVHGRTWSGRPDFDLATDCEDLSLMNGLVAMGIETFAVDMRGYGETPRDESGWLTPNRAARDIAGVLGWLFERARQTSEQSREPSGDQSSEPSSDEQFKAHLFGWSYGATMAQLAVQQQPQLAKSLSLFGYAVRRGYSTTPKNLPLEPPRAANTHANAISDFIVPNSINPGAIEAFALAALAADPIRTDWNNLEQWKALDARKVSVPTLLLQGEFDPLTRRRVHKKLFRRLPHANKQWVVLKGGDHAAFMETPRAEFITTLARFVLDNNTLDNTLDNYKRETP